MEFKRPQGTFYPQIYTRFTVKVEGSDEIEEFYIQDLTEKFFDSAVEIILENHGKNETFNKAANTMALPLGIQRVRESYRAVFKEKISLVCIKMGTYEIAAINALCIKNREDLIVPDTSEDKCFKLLTDAKNFIHSSFSVLDHYEVDQFMFSGGLCVLKKFHGRGIAAEILKARAPLMKEIGLQVTSSFFTDDEAQKAAEAAGFEVNFSISYEELQKQFPDMDFSHASETSCKVLSLKI